jgi:hypothetical protein
LVKNWERRSTTFKNHLDWNTLYMEKEKSGRLFIYMTTFQLFEWT